MLDRLLRWLTDLTAEVPMTVTEVEQAAQHAEREAARAELLRWLAEANRHAKRQQYVIEKFMDDPPTKWSVAHHDLDDLLEQLDALKSCG